MSDTPEEKSSDKKDEFMLDDALIEIDGLMEYAKSIESSTVVFSKELFDEELDAADISPEIRNAVREAIQETEVEKHSVMFIATDGDLAIKAILVPKSAIMGADGPVLFAGADGHTVIAAWSKEFIEEQLEIIDNKIPGAQEKAWHLLLQWMTEEATLEYHNNPPKWGKDID